MGSANTRSTERPKTYDRRDFLIHTSVSALCTGCSVFTSKAQTDARLTPTKGTITLDAAATSSLKGVGSVYRIQVPEGPRIIVIRQAVGLLAFSAACTHWGSDVAPNKKGEFECPTHGSRFSSTTGAVLEGPADSPLDQYAVTESVNGTIIRISLKKTAG